MLWEPSTDYRYAFKKGMEGTDVAALQINLGDIAVDGTFGPATKASVMKFQAVQNLVTDGNAGPATMQRLVRTRSLKAEKTYTLPVGFLPSVAVNESNFNVAAVSKHPSDSGIDVGAYQLSTGAQLASQEFYADAYKVTYAADRTGARARAYKDKVPDPVASQYLTDMAANNKGKFKWQMTILNHNWPAAAQNIPLRGHIYTNPAQDDQPANWVISASGGRLSTPRQWVYSYVERSSVFIIWN